jgi:hypothetical protein
LLICLYSSPFRRHDRTLNGDAAGPGPAGRSPAHRDNPSITARGRPGSHASKLSVHCCPPKTPETLSSGHIGGTSALEIPLNAENRAFRTGSTGCISRLLTSSTHARRLGSLYGRPFGNRHQHRRGEHCGQAERLPEPGHRRPGLRAVSDQIRLMLGPLGRHILVEDEASAKIRSWKLFLHENKLRYATTP